MSNLFVVAYDDVATANQVRDKLFELSKQHLVELEDAVVVERHEDGRIKLHQAVSHTAVGAAGGALWGGVIGLLFLAPLLGRRWERRPARPAARSRTPGSTTAS